MFTSGERDEQRGLLYDHLDMLTIMQLLRQDEAIVSMRPKHPRAIVLCTTEELSDEVGLPSVLFEYLLDCVWFCCPLGS